MSLCTRKIHEKILSKGGNNKLFFDHKLTIKLFERSKTMKLG